MGARKPMLLGCWITGGGILLTAFTFLLVGEYLVFAFVGFTLFGIGLGLYATPSTDAALANVPQQNAGSASGIYKMASSLGLPLASQFPPQSSAATSGLRLRWLTFNILMVAAAIIAIMMTLPRRNHRTE
jgi:MFS transporter, DHA2 family, multidrug resistance protein